MNSQRENNRNLIANLLKVNFEAALFMEKRNDLMADDDFTKIRDEIEEEYFIKNTGMAPYIKAIKYLRSKIETCTSTHTLFASLEDYIIAKNNIVITKVVNPPQQMPPKLVKPGRGRKKQQPVDGDMNKPVAHPDCKSPKSCKKCRIMRRPEAKVRKTREVAAIKNIQKDAKTNGSHTTMLENLDATIARVSTMETDPIIEGKKVNDVRNSGAHIHDHRYSRICFYGTGLSEDAPKDDVPKDGVVKGDVPKNEIPKSDVEKKGASKDDVANNNNNQPLIPNSLPTTLPMVSVNSGQIILKRRAVPGLLPNTASYRFKPNNGLRQMSPTFYTKRLFPTLVTPATSTQPIPTIVRPQIVHTGHVTAPSPIAFSPPRLIIQAPMMPHPIYLVNLYQPPNNMAKDTC